MAGTATISWFNLSGGGGGGGFSASDNFNRANETPIGGNWTNVYANINLSSNTFTGSVADDCYAYWNAGSPTANQSSQVVLTGNTGIFGVTVRMSGTDSASLSGYLLIIDPGGEHYRLVRVTAGSSWTDIIAETGHVLAGTETMKLEIVGTTLNIYINGALLDTATDANIASGRPGIYADGHTTVTVDNWTGADA